MKRKEKWRVGFSVTIGETWKIKDGILPMLADESVRRGKVKAVSIPENWVRINIIPGVDWRGTCQQLLESWERV